MGKKAKSSRKGKKAWRANISTEDIDDFLEKSTKDALSGSSLSHVSNDSLFFVDKSKDLSVRRKIEKRREKVLRCDSVLQKNPFVQVVPSSANKSDQRKFKKLPIHRNDVSQEDETAPTSTMVDIWEKEGELNEKSRKISKPSIIPAVEVEPPGCSFNPSSEDHKDSLAQAVANEMQKVYQTELGPQPVPLIVPGQPIDEEDMYFIDVDNGSDDDENEEDDDENIIPEKRSRKEKRVTRVELNKRARVKENRRREAEAKKKDELSKEIDCLPDILKEIAKEDEEKHNRHIRRLISKEERLKTRPPRLGKHKFEPAPPQVLLSEEITGSLRKLKACCTLARDRFKSLEKRGLIAPLAKRRGTWFNSEQDIDISCMNRHMTKLGDRKFEIKRVDSHDVVAIKCGVHPGTYTKNDLIEETKGIYCLDRQL